MCVGIRKEEIALWPRPCCYEVDREINSRRIKWKLTSKDQSLSHTWKSMMDMDMTSPFSSERWQINPFDQNRQKMDCDREATYWLREPTAYDIVYCVRMYGGELRTLVLHPTSSALGLWFVSSIITSIQSCYTPRGCHCITDIYDIPRTIPKALLSPWSEM